MADPNKVEQAANAAMRAGGGAGGRTSMLQYMLARLAQNANRTPARSNSEALGRGLGMFLMPMIAQGMQTWKENYDARGSWKEHGKEIYERWKAGEQLNPQDQRTLDVMRQRYPELFNSTATQTVEPQPQQTTPPPTPQESLQGSQQGIQPSTPSPQNLQQPVPDVSNETLDAVRAIMREQNMNDNPTTDAPFQPSEIPDANSIGALLAKLGYNPPSDNPIMQWLSRQRG